MPVKAKRKYIILTILAIVAVLTVVVNQISVYPFMWTFRGLMSFTSEQGDPGNYEVYTQEKLRSHTKQSLSSSHFKGSVLVLITCKASLD